MLNPFPIQFLALLAYFILRLFVGGILVYLGFKHWRYRQELRHVFHLSWWPYGRFSTAMLILTEFLLAGFIIAGAFTQYALLILALMCLKLLVLRSRFDHHSIPSRLFYVLLLGAALTLFITGAGALAFDLPI